MSQQKPPKYIGIDLETTGLDPARDRILEIAWVLLDEDLVELSSFHEVVDAPSSAIEQGAARAMHEETGLVRKRGAQWVIDAGGFLPTSLATIEERLYATLEVLPEPPILAGQSVHFDRGFLERWMPHAAGLLHHRNLDARTVMLLWPNRDWPEPTTKHRAMPDLQASIETLRLARLFGCPLPEAAP